MLKIKIHNVQIISEDNPVSCQAGPMITRTYDKEILPKNNKSQIERCRIRPAAIVPVKCVNIFEKRSHHYSHPLRVKVCA
jgi:hypothetical protein